MNYLQTIDSYEKQIVKAKQVISNITFNEDNIKQYKENIADARKLSKEINQLRIDYEKWHKSQIEEDISKLKSWTSELEDVIGIASSDFDTWYEEQQLERVQQTKEIFDTLYENYEQLEYFCTNDVWEYVIYEDHFQSDLTSSKREKLLLQKLNDFNNIVSLIQKEDYDLFQEQKFNIVEYQNVKSILDKHIETIEPVKVDTPIGENDDKVKITIKQSDLKLVKGILTRNGVWYDV